MEVKEILDRVTVHLLEQGERAACINDDGDLVCRYRADNGQKCAVGCLIPDEKYKGRFEGVAVCPSEDDIGNGIDEIAFYKMLGEIGLSEHLMLLHQLQAIHDSQSPEYWGQVLGEVYKQYRVEPSEEAKELLGV